MSADEGNGYFQNRLLTIAILFGVTGFLGLPLLWINRRFSEWQRWLIALVNTVYTLVLIYIVYLICLWSYSRVFPS